jgi:hypothetical protein
MRCEPGRERVEHEETKHTGLFELSPTPNTADSPTYHGPVELVVPPHTGSAAAGE